MSDQSNADAQSNKKNDEKTTEGKIVQITSDMIDDPQLKKIYQEMEEEMKINQEYLNSFGEAWQKHFRFAFDYVRGMQSVERKYAYSVSREQFDEAVLETMDPFRETYLFLDAAGSSKKYRQDADTLLKILEEYVVELESGKARDTDATKDTAATKNADNIRDLARRTSEHAESLIETASIQEPIPANFVYSAAIDMFKFHRGRHGRKTRDQSFALSAKAKFLLAKEMGLNIHDLGFMIYMIKNSKKMYDSLIEEFGKGCSREAKERVENAAYHDAFVKSATPSTRAVYKTFPGLNAVLADTKFHNLFSEAMFDKEYCGAATDLSIAGLVLKYQPKNYEETAQRYITAAIQKIKKDPAGKSLNGSFHIPLLDGNGVDNAIAILKKYSESPMTTKVYDALVSHYAYVDFRSGAIQALNHIPGIEKNANMLNLRGRQYMLIGNNKEAIADLEKSVALFEKKAQISDDDKKLLRTLPQWEIHNILKNHKFGSDEQRMNAYQNYAWLGALVKQE